MENGLDRLVQWFESAEEAGEDGRKEAEQARDYYDGAQLTSKEMETLRKRGQPPVIINRIKDKINYLRGVERQNRTDPVAYPRTPSHEEEAQAATDALRFIADDQRVDVKRSQVWDNMLVEGFGGVEVGVKRGRNGVDVKITRLPWDRCFADPHSAEPDYSDARYLGYLTWMDQAEAIAMWPDAKDVIEATMDNPTSGTSDTFDDKPKTVWADTKRKRVCIVSMCWREKGKWHWAKFTRLGAVEEPGPVPFLDEDGEPECPLIFQSAYVDRDNDRYGVVRAMISPQDELNKRRSKALHLLNSTTVRVSETATQDPETIRKEVNRPDGIVIGNKDDFEILHKQADIQGHFHLMQESKAEIDGMGPNATMQGKAGNDQSGRAVIALQQGGMVELAPLLDQLRDFNVRLFRQCWNRVRQYWTEERWVRVTDDDKGVQFVGINTTQGALALRKLQALVKAGQVNEQQAQQFAMQIQQSPVFMAPANQVAQLDVDILIDETLDSPTVQMEQFEQLANMLGSAPPHMQPVLWEMLVQASSLRDKQKLIEIMEQMKQAQNQPPGPEQQIMLETAMAAIEETRSKTMKNIAQAQSASMGTNDPEEQMLRAQENRIKAFDAETKRIQAVRPAA